MARPVTLIEVRSEMGAGTFGASLGVDALHIAARVAHADLLDRTEPLRITSPHLLATPQSQFAYARHIDSIAPIEQAVCQAVCAALRGAAIPILLLGDHSSSFGSIAGVHQAYPNKRIGVIWIDAHADLHSPYTTPSGNVHGMPLALAAGIDNRTAHSNTVDEETASHWEALKATGSPGPKILPQDIIYMGLRSYEEPERSLIERHGIRCFFVDEIRSRGAAASAQLALQTLEACDLIYVSFDVDSVGAELSRGTGTPVSHGLTFEEAHTLNRELVKSPKLCAWDMAEINPILDAHNSMAVGVQPIFNTVLATLSGLTPTALVLGS